jgi:hypothetical protein
MLPFADVLDLFANELSRLRGRRFPFAPGLLRSSQRLPFGHDCTSSDGRLEDARQLLDTADAGTLPGRAARAYAERRIGTSTATQ